MTRWADVTRWFVWCGWALVIALAPGSSAAYPDRVVTTLTVGEGPSDVVLDGNNQYAYVANTTDNTVSRIDVYRFLLVDDGAEDPKPLTVGTGPVALALGPDDGVLFVANSTNSTVSAVDLPSFKDPTSFAVGVFPRGLAVNPVESALYVATRLDGILCAYDTSDHKLLESVLIDEVSEPYGVAVTPDGATVLVALGAFNSVLFLDADTFESQGTVAVGSVPVGITVDPDGTFAYVANSGSDSITKIHIADLKVQDSVDVGDQPFGVRVDPDNAYLFVTHEGDDTVGVVDLSDFTLVQPDIDVGAAPRGVALTSDGRYLLVCNNDDDSVSVLTDGPYVTVLKTEPAAIDAVGVSTVTWRSDRSGTYQVEAGGNGVQGSGSPIADGQVQADVDVETQVSAADLVEGDGAYYVFAYVTDSDGQTTGRIGTLITLDTVVPSPPSNLEADPASGALTLRWQAATDSGSGVDGYRVYYGTVSGQLDNQVDAGNVVEYWLTGLQDGVTYFVAVTALDKAGNESDPSNETHEIPESVQGAVPSGGGCFVRVAGDGAWGPAAVVVLGAALMGVLLAVPGILRRIGVSLILTAALCGALPAWAQPDLNVTGVMIGFRAGYYAPMHGRVQDTYDKGGFAGACTITWINETNFETLVGLGLLAAEAPALTTSGRKSGQDARLYVVPVELAVRYRFQFAEKQTFVPYLGVGLEALYYREEIQNGGTEDGFTGGYSGSVGIRLLLNAFDRYDADFMYRATGVKESFLFLEGRYEELDRFGQEDFDVGGFTVAMGIELKF